MSGKLHSTENTYKYKIQLQNDDEEEDAAEESTTQNSSQHLISKDEDLKVNEIAGTTTIVDNTGPFERAVEGSDKELEMNQSNLVSDGEPVSIAIEHGKEETNQESNDDKSIAQDASLSSSQREVGVEVKESDV